MKITAISFLLAFILVVVSIVNYSVFVKNQAVTEQLYASSSNKDHSSQARDIQIPRWMWFLPILALPLLLVPIDREEDKDEEDFDYWLRQLQSS